MTFKQQKGKRTIDKMTKKDYNENVRNKHAPLAQLVEQLTLNQMVGGSNPLWRTIKTTTCIYFYKIKCGGYFFVLRIFLSLPIIHILHKNVKHALVKINL